MSAERLVAVKPLVETSVEDWDAMMAVNAAS